MNEPRNPFTLLASENIQSDDVFVRLFGTGVLDILDNQEIWKRIQIFRSAPGGGKTSLFRLFTPPALMTLYNSRSNEEYKELYNRLKSFNVVTEEGPSLLGVLVSCAERYDRIEYTSFERGYKDRLFYSLLNCRIVLAALRAASALKGLEFPSELDMFDIARPNISLPTALPVPCSGLTLYEWASELEKNVCITLDSFASPTIDFFLGFETLYSLHLIQSNNITYEGNKIAQQTLLLLDDAHKLPDIHRQQLLDSLFDLKLPMGIWLAERLEALSLNELLATGGIPGREYNVPIVLEEFWRPEGNSKRFEKTVADIASRRARLNPEIQSVAFEGYLQNSLDTLDWNNKYSEIAQEISNRILEKTKQTKKYEKWVTNCAETQGTQREKAILWRALEIKIYRDLKKAQQQLLNSPLPEIQTDLKLESAIRAAAELFISHENHIPYYFGFSSLARLASSNIEQFLQLSSNLFEEYISLRLIQRRNIVTLSPERQEEILKKVVDERLKKLPQILPDGRRAIRLLQALGEICIKETKKPNAPYAPGVTGVAISMADKERLVSPVTQKNHPNYARLARVIGQCVSSNLLEAFSDRSQGQRGRKWMILYLNRMLCLHFGLPVQYGGWRPIRLTELSRYIE
jgi:hypothetical protein